MSDRLPAEILLDILAPLDQNSIECWSEVDYFYIYFYRKHYNSFPLRDAKFIIQFNCASTVSLPTILPITLVRDTEFHPVEWSQMRTRLHSRCGLRFTKVTVHGHSLFDSFCTPRKLATLASVKARWTGAEVEMLGDYGMSYWNLYGLVELFSNAGYLQFHTHSERLPAFVLFAGVFEDNMGALGDISVYALGNSSLIPSVLAWAVMPSRTDNNRQMSVTVGDSITMCAFVALADKLLTTDAPIRHRITFRVQEPREAKQLDKSLRNDFAAPFHETFVNHRNGTVIEIMYMKPLTYVRCSPAHKF